MPAKIIVIAAFAYVVTAGVVALLQPGRDVAEAILAGLQWPVPVFGFVWDHVASFYGRLFG